MRENLRKTVCLLLLFMLAVSVVFLAVSCKKADKAAEKQCEAEERGHKPYGTSVRHGQFYAQHDAEEVKYKRCKRIDIFTHNGYNDITDD